MIDQLQRLSCFNGALLEILMRKDLQSVQEEHPALMLLKLSY